MQAFVAHEVIVQLVKAVFPRGVPLQGLPSEVVVIYYENVGVDVTPCGIGMNADEVVR